MWAVYIKASTSILRVSVCMWEPLALLANHWVKHFWGRPHFILSLLFCKQAQLFVKGLASNHGSILDGQKLFPAEPGQWEGKVWVSCIVRFWDIPKEKWRWCSSHPQRGSTHSVPGMVSEVEIQRWKLSLGLQQFPVHGERKPTHTWRALYLPWIFMSVSSLDSHNSPAVNLDEEAFEIYFQTRETEDSKPLNWQVVDLRLESRSFIFQTRSIFHP